MRQCHDWIRKYIDIYGPIAEAPEQYHFWSAATVIGSVLRRHVWVERGTFRLFPNMFTVLIGRPGIGKGSALHPSIDILNKSKAANFMTGRITIEWVLEKLSKGFAGPVISASGNGQMTIGVESSVLLFSPEFNVFVSASQHSLKILTDLWDSKEGIWDYGTRQHGEYMVRDPCVSMLAGCTPDALVELIPSQAIGGGFTRRVNFVYAKDNSILIPWPGESPASPELISDLRQIMLLHGEFRWEPSARALFENYYRRTRGADKQAIKDEATANYETSMYVHAIKLAMILSASRGDDLIIRTRDWTEAAQRINDCSETIKKVFRSAGSSDLAFAMGKVLNFIEARGFASRQDILQYNWQDITTVDLEVLIATLIGADAIEEYTQAGKVLYRSK